MKLQFLQSLAGHEQILNIFTQNRIGCKLKIKIYSVPSNVRPGGVRYFSTCSSIKSFIFSAVWKSIPDILVNINQQKNWNEPWNLGLPRPYNGDVLVLYYSQIVDFFRTKTYIKCLSLTAICVINNDIVHHTSKFWVSVPSIIEKPQILIL